MGGGAVTIGSSNYNLVGQQGVVVQMDQTGNVLWSQLLPSEFPEYVIAGGGQIYEQAMAFADRIYLTVIHPTVDDGDAFFPDYDKKNWKETARDDRDGFSFITLDRAAPSA